MVDMVLLANVKGAYKTTTCYVNLYLNCIERGSSHRVFLTHIQPEVPQSPDARLS